ncbi:MAG: MBL fold metallo-hydrolase, partial [Lachnospiraceae bacterium]|nr:MBL fold metallo-hydrolase [Lachnospiraceae bacterium]
EKYGSDPDAVISGFHLKMKREYTPEELCGIKNIAHELVKHSAVFYTCHCTGLPAYEAMKDIMGDRLIYVHTGEDIL